MRIGVGLRPVAGLQVDEGAVDRPLGPADQVGAGRMLPAFVVVHPAGDSVGGGVEAVAREGVVGAQQRRDGVLEHLGEVEFVGQGEARRDAGQHWVIGGGDRLVGDVVAVSGVQPPLAAQLARAVEEAPAQPFGVLRPGGPAGQRVVQGDDPLAFGQQGFEPGLEGGVRLDVAGAGVGGEVQPRHVVEHERVEAAHALGVHQPRGGGLLHQGAGDARQVVEDRHERVAQVGVALGGHQDVQRLVVADDGHGAPPYLDPPHAAHGEVARRAGGAARSADDAAATRGVCGVPLARGERPPPGSAVLPHLRWGRSISSLAAEVTASAAACRSSRPGTGASASWGRSPARAGRLPCTASGPRGSTS